MGCQQGQRPTDTENICMVKRIIPAAILALVAAFSPAHAADGQTAQEERNKQIAIAFYNAALNDKDWEKTKSFIGNRYVQHNLNAIDGPEGLRAHIEFLKKEFPNNRGEIKRALADGDLVALHIHNRRSPELRGNAVVDIFRIENGKVVEHWDVVQAIPEPEQAKNPNTMF
jgi:predicted SnoaL-like aldol condensation-catalyzing enzyme